MLATDLPSIWRWKARFHPKFGTLSTVRRPGRGLPCATVLMEIAHRKARIRRTLLTKLCLGFMAHITHTISFSPVLTRATLPLFERPLARAFRSRYPLRPKRESQRPNWSCQVGQIFSKLCAYFENQRFIVRADERLTALPNSNQQSGCIGEIRAICSLMFFRFRQKIVLTPSGGGLQDRAAPSCLGVSRRAPPDPLSAGQPASESFARTTKTSSMKNLSEKVRIRPSNPNICARVFCAFAASASHLPRRLLNERKHRPR